MSIDSTGIAANVGGLSMAQLYGHDAERVREEVGAQRRQVYYEQKAEVAADVGELDGDDHETAERDGDGRRPWEEQASHEVVGQASHRQSKDPSQQSGNLLDLTG